MSTSTATAARTSGGVTSDHSIVAIDRFIQATRDSGYKGTVSAISELVDNCLQAGAKRVELIVRKTEDPTYPLEVFVCDDGCGMTPQTLRQAMRFGGSTRFGDRGGLGRYGMGLPNSSLSQARTVSVFSWTSPEDIYYSYLDVDEIAAGRVHQVPRPERVSYPFTDEEPAPSGTIVWWTQCDRLDHRRASTIQRKLAAGLGRKFRYFLWEGVELTINGSPVQPIDPLYLREDSAVSGAQPYGEPLEYELLVNPDSPAGGSGRVTVTFSELPIAEWAKLSNQEKRLRGISKGAGVSVVRGGREVDYGWFFMGGKRRENYDDWWRCEVRFDPALDEAFGITHTKQQIRPAAYVLEELVPDLEATARQLNSRARRAYTAVKAASEASEAEQRASQRDGRLKPLPSKPTSRDRRVLTALRALDPSLRAPAPDEGTEYRVIVARTPANRGAEPFFDYAHEQGRLVLAINPDHAFYERVYRPLLESGEPSDAQLRSKLDLVLLALSRELVQARGSAGRALDRLQASMSDTLEALLKAR